MCSRVDPFDDRPLLFTRQAGDTLRFYLVQRAKPVDLVPSLRGHAPVDVPDKWAQPRRRRINIAFAQQVLIAHRWRWRAGVTSAGHALGLDDRLNIVVEPDLTPLR